MRLENSRDLVVQNSRNYLENSRFAGIVLCRGEFIRSNFGIRRNEEQTSGESHRATINFPEEKISQPEVLE